MLKHHPSVRHKAWLDGGGAGIHLLILLANNAVIAHITLTNNDNRIYLHNNIIYIYWPKLLSYINCIYTVPKIFFLFSSMTFE